MKWASTKSSQVTFQCTCGIDGVSLLVYIYVMVCREFLGLKDRTCFLLFYSKNKIKKHSKLTSFISSSSSSSLSHHSIPGVVRHFRAHSRRGQQIHLGRTGGRHPFGSCSPFSRRR